MTNIQNCEIDEIDEISAMLYVPGTFQILQSRTWKTARSFDNLKKLVNVNVLKCDNKQVKLKKVALLLNIRQLWGHTFWKNNVKEKSMYFNDQNPLVPGCSFQKIPKPCFSGPTLSKSFTDYLNTVQRLPISSETTRHKKTSLAQVCQLTKHCKPFVKFRFHLTFPVCFCFWI